MKIVLASVGSRGDVQPMLALAVGLRAAGHDVCVSAPPAFQAWAQRLNVPFRGLGRDLEAWSRQAATTTSRGELAAISALMKVVMEDLPRQARELEEAAEGASMILAAGMVTIGAS